MGCSNPKGTSDLPKNIIRKSGALLPASILLCFPLSAAPILVLVHLYVTAEEEAPALVPMAFSQRGLPWIGERNLGVCRCKEKQHCTSQKYFLRKIYTVCCIGSRPDFSQSRLKFYKIFLLFLHEKYFRLVGKSRTFFSKPRLENNNGFLICRLQAKRGAESNCKKGACPIFFSKKRAGHKI